MGENSNSDDDLSGLFSQVASKLGWKSDQDLDSVLSELSQSTKKKKKRKCSTKCQKKTTKAKGRKGDNGDDQSKTHSAKIKSFHRDKTSHVLSKNDKIKEQHVKSSSSYYVETAIINENENVLRENLQKSVEEPHDRRNTIQTSPCASLMLTNASCKSTSDKEINRDIDVAIRSAQKQSLTVDLILGKDENQDSYSRKEQSSVRRKTNLSYEGGQNDSAGSAIFDSPLPRFLDFGDTPEEDKPASVISHQDTKTTNSVCSSESISFQDGDVHAGNNAQTPQKDGKSTVPLSDSFVDSPEPMQWFMSPKHKKSLSSDPPSHVIASSSDEGGDISGRDVAEANDDVLADNIIDLPDFRVLSLTERLAQKHKEARQKNASPATRKQRRRSCANPRSKPLILDKDWADDDNDENENGDNSEADGGDDDIHKDDDDDDDGDKEDEKEDEKEESPDNRNNKQESHANNRGDNIALRKENASTKSFEKARVKFQDSSSDDDFESFLSAIKTPQHPRGKGGDSDSDEVVEVINDDDDDFIDDTPLKSNSDDEDDDDDVFYLKLINADNPLTSDRTRSTKMKRPTVGSRSGSVFGVIMVSDDEDEDDEDVFVLPKTTTSVRKEKPKVGTSATTSKKTTSKPRHPLQTKSLSSNLPSSTTVQSKTDPPAPVSFLRSLSTPGKGVLPRSRYVSDFKRHKDELTQRLFGLYNESVFENKLPADFGITWNNRMRKTAGFCFYKKRMGERTARIELSVKVCDSAERLRDTLIHEMCHAAAWLIHGVSDGHGKFWKYWAAKANLAHPEIPVIRRCHTYEIQTKYKYKCVQCGNIIGRHSKSINTERFCCALCSGRLELQPTLRKDGTPARPRGPNLFAAFVKENYASVKKTHSTAKHADVMKLLSQEFSSKAKITES